MARVRFATGTEGAIALSASATKTVMQIVAPTNQRVVLRGFSVSFNGISAVQEPCEVRLVKQTDAGTTSAATPVKEGGGAETIQSTSRKTATVEPTTTDIYRRYYVHPQSGRETKFSFADEIEIPGGGRLGVVVVTPSGANYNVVGHMSAEE